MATRSGLSSPGGRNSANGLSPSASLMVGSSSIRASPAMTRCPSRTWIARMMPVSNGWMILVRPLETILPCAEATMSICPRQAQMRARQKIAMMKAPIARPVGDTGVSTISSAAGRNASSSAFRLVRAVEGFCSGLPRLTSFMDPCLNAMQRRVTPAAGHQLVMGAVFDHPATVDGDDAIGTAHRRQAVGDDDDGAPAHDGLHVLLDDAFALIVECARCLVEDQDARLGD